MPADLWERRLHGGNKSPGAAPPFSPPHVPAQSPSHTSGGPALSNHVQSAACRHGGPRMSAAPPTLELPEGQLSGPISSPDGRSGQPEGQSETARVGKAGLRYGPRRRCQVVASCLLPPLARLLSVFIVTRASEPVLGPGARGQRPEAWAPHVPAGRTPRSPRRLAPQACAPGRARAGEGQCAGEGAAVHR